MTTDLSKFGLCVRRRRKELGYTQAALAEKCGMSVPYIGHIERATRSPSLENLLSLCEALDVTPDYLLQDYLPSTDLTPSGDELHLNEIHTAIKVLRVLEKQSSDVW